MFKKRIVDWKLNKNYKATERKAVARVIEQYKNRGDPIPSILIRGQLVKMHRIQRHCKIGLSVAGPFKSAESFDSSVLEKDAGQIQPGGHTAELNKDIYLIDDARIPADYLQKMATLFTIPLRQLSPPDELKHSEFVVFQTNTFYELFAQSIVTAEMESNMSRESEAELEAVVVVNPGAFACKVSAAFLSLESSQPKAGWRLMSEAMDMIKPMLASKHPYNLSTLLCAASEWKVLLPPDFYEVIWGQITKMAFIVLGEYDPLSKVCLAITHIESKSHVYEIVGRLIRTIFERTLGPYAFETLQAKSWHISLLIDNGDFAVAERLQRMLISDFEELGDESLRKQELVLQLYKLGCILEGKKDFVGVKKVFLEALHLGRETSGERLPTQVDIYCINSLVLRLAEDEYIEGEVLLQEALEKCLKYEHWGRYDWLTVSVLGSLENLLKKQEKFDEAGMLRLQYPEAF